MLRSIRAKRASRDVAIWEKSFWSFMSREGGNIFFVQF